METDLTQVNEHYLERVMSLATTHDVEASEDIYAANGMKLIAKGAKLSGALQERLIVHKLKKPLETSLQVADGITPDGLRTSVSQLFDEVPEIRTLFGSESSGHALLALLGSADLNQGMSLLLTLAQRAGETTLSHYLLVSTLSYGIAQRVKLSENQLTEAALAGLLHDIGELYINPAYLKHQHTLHPSEWRHILAHPVIAHKLLTETTSLPASLAQAVLEHHERFNGYGYPRRIGGSAISRTGQILALAEMIAGIFMKRKQPLARAELAVKIVPGEHARELVAAISSVFREHDHGDASSTEADPIPPVVISEAAQRITRATQDIKRWITQGQPPPREGDMLQQCSYRLSVIERVFLSTGVDRLIDAELTDALHEPQIRFEAAQVIHEILWRLRELARDLAAQVSTLPPERVERYVPLIELLNGPG